MGTSNLRLVNWFVVAFPLMVFSCMEPDLEDPAPKMEMISSEEVAHTMGLMEEVDLLALSALQQDLTQQKISPLVEVSSCPGSIFRRDEKNKRIRIDFGDGCVSSRGIEKKGIVIIDYTDEFLIKGSKVTIAFEDFYLNGHQLKGSRSLENLGFEVNSRSLRISSVTSDFQMTSRTGKTFNLNLDYIRNLHLSTDKKGFRIYLEGYGNLSSSDDQKTSFEIIHPVVYLQECMNSGLSIPSKGSVQLKGEKDLQVLITFDSEGCTPNP
ncbi:hypothetical protein [Cyclobacterium roseum]|uniref:hypothetical protein n=1 Tax=Cyclobacterium roseum TaxID=2666137 RepID=UPI0013908DD6|nr:hypothetical protein [Cyclobacterium roseum]